MKMRGNKSFAAGGLAAGLAMAIASPGAALAADPLLEQRMAPNPTIDTVVYWGADFTYGNSDRNGIGVDAGFVTALNGDLGSGGWTISGNLGLSRSEDIGSDTESVYGSLLLGYIWPGQGYYFTAAGGVNFVNNDETPPGSVTDGSSVGAIVQYGFETTRSNAFYAQSYGSYSTANDQVYVHAKVGYKASRLRFGPEFTVSDDKGSRPTLRYGAFVGDITLGEKVSMIVSAGYQQELEPGTADRFYAAVGFSVPLSLR